MNALYLKADLLSGMRSHVTGRWYLCKEWE